MGVATTAQRGYGGAHQKLRAAALVKVDRGEQWCARCGQWIAPTGRPCVRCAKPTRKGGKAGRGFCGFDLGHVDGDKTRHQGPEHTCCNRSAAGRESRRRQTQAQGARQTPARADWW